MLDFTLKFLFLFMACYGYAWIITKSRLTSNLRLFFKTRSTPFYVTTQEGDGYKKEKNRFAFLYKELSYFFSCIVCQSYWIAICVWYIQAKFTPNKLEVLYNLPEALITLGAIVTCSWVLSNLIGDAD